MSHAPLEGLELVAEAGLAVLDLLVRHEDLVLAALLGARADVGGLVRAALGAALLLRSGRELLVAAVGVADELAILVLLMLLMLLGELVLIGLIIIIELLDKVLLVHKVGLALKLANAVLGLDIGLGLVGLQQLLEHLLVVRLDCEIKQRLVGLVKLLVDVDGRGLDLHGLGLDLHHGLGLDLHHGLGLDLHHGLGHRHSRHLCKQLLANIGLLVNGLLLHLDGRGRQLALLNRYGSAGRSLLAHIHPHRHGLGTHFIYTLKTCNTYNDSSNLQSYYLVYNVIKFQFFIL